MQRLRNARLCAALLIALATPAMAESFNLASLDWPPYTGEKLAGQGISSQVVKAVFEKAGADVNFKFLPWQRAVDTARSDASFVGYFPEYADPSSPCLFSEPIGNGPLGFAEQSAKPINWTSLADLKSIKIGVVTGYVNTAEFDKMAAAGELKTDAATSDELNLLKLANGRFDLAVVDQNVMQYLLQTSPKLKPLAAKLQFNGKPLEDKTLHVCFTNSAAGKLALEQFNAALKLVDIKQLNQQATQ
ncbi:MAG: transporter substrate-binding domain-containing protein [Pseudomonas sp.]|nr:transporter substrate-binding domain-containing protein [Pseudomonas sp.]